MFGIVIWAGGYIFFFMIDNHIEDTIVMTKIKNIEIMSTTMADLIRNDLTMTSSVLYESASSLSDIMSY